MVSKFFYFFIILLTSSQLVFAQWNEPFIKVNSDAPNILWICTDQQRWNTIGALGNKFVHTPNLDRLVREGVSFLNAFCQAPACTPSRASFMTGMYPATVHACKLGMDHWPETVPLISQMLHNAGYDCGLAGKLHLSTAMAHRPEKRPKNDGYRKFYFSHSPSQGGSSNQYLVWLHKNGFNYDSIHKKNGYIPTQYHQTTWCASKAIEFIKEDREQPWFFSLNFYDPHPPLDPPKEFLDKYNINMLPKPWVNDSDIQEKRELNDIFFQSKPRKYTPQENKEREAKYWAQIDLIDQNIGRILDILRKTGQLDNTLIIFSTDHGDMLGDHGFVAKGCRFYEGLVHVPLIFWYPKALKHNLQSKALIELIDIVPTLLDVVGLYIPDRIQGKTLLPILTGKASPDSFRRFVRSSCYNCFATPENEKGSYGTMLRTKHYKIINYHSPVSKGELYDLKKDPKEFHNVWNDPQYENVKLRLMQLSFDATAKAIDTGPKRVARY